MEKWRAPRAMGPVDATVSVPGSKSITNRALVLAALADGPSRITGALDARDTRLMVGALRALGIGIGIDVTASTNTASTNTGSTNTGSTNTGCIDLAVTPGPMRGPAHIDAGLAGTVMRFIAPVAALADGRVDVDGDEQARKRPMAPLLDALRGLGAGVDGDGLPFVVHGTGTLTGGEATLDASASSQFASALLLAGARFANGLDLRMTGPVPSRPHIDMTLAMLREQGVSIAEPEPGRWVVAPGALAAVDRAIEPDLSNATPFLAAAMVTRGRVRIAHWPQHSLQAAGTILSTLTAMGASIAFDGSDLVLTMDGPVRGIDADLSAVGEIVPTIAALAALADTPSTLHGIAHLRGHETDRLAALATELTAVGATTTELPDGLRIEPASHKSLRPHVFRSYADHRMATAGAIVGLVADGIDVDDIGCTDKTLPAFDARWRAMLNERVSAGDTA